MQIMFGLSTIYYYRIIFMKLFARNEQETLFQSTMKIVLWLR